MTVHKARYVTYVTLSLLFYRHTHVHGTVVYPNCNTLQKKEKTMAASTPGNMTFWIQNDNFFTARTK